MTASAPPSPPPIAWLPISGAAVAVTLLLFDTNNRYDYHRDEFYFRMLKPAWGYVDQPPLTPFLARAATTVLGDSLWAIRFPAAICVAMSVFLVALITRELGGGRAAQAVSAWGYAFAGFPLLVGHVLLTATVDLPIWLAVILFIVRALLRDEPRWWLAAGAVVGLGLYNKHLIVLLLIGLAVGLLLVGPRRVLLSPWLWGGVGLAVLVGSPNLIYQATHGFPQLDMAAALSEDNAGEVRATLLPFQLILLGPPLAAIWIAGLVALFRRPEWRPVRALAIGYPVLIVIVFFSGGQVYYPVGLLVFLFAAGCIPVVDWVRRAVRSRRPWLIAALGLNAVVSVLIALPVLPLDVLAKSPIPEINPGVQDQIGWRTYVRQIAAVYRGLPIEDQVRAVLFTANYGEAGALDKYGPGYELPDVYSGQNELHRYGPPPEAKTVAIVVGDFDLPALQRRFGSCTVAGHLDNERGADNEEQGVPIMVCRDPVGGWAALWPQLQHYS